jgi:stage II sporulation protein GA (sporulation sigma-E factor processing peptidase)
MTVYLDLVMGLNFAVDFLLLLGTNSLAGFPPGVRRNLWASALGAVYGAGCLLPGMGFLGNSFWRLVFLTLMGAVAFGLGKDAWKRTGIFILLSMALGGMALGMNQRGIPALLLAAAGVWWLSRMAFGNRIGGREYVEVTVREGERTASAVALRDTGNTLSDPITGEQVLILGPEAAKKLLGLEEAELLAPLEAMLSHPGKGYRLIPYRAVGRGGSMLLAKKFSQIQIGDVQRSGIVAFAPERIGVGQMYQALVGG